MSITRRQFLLSTAGASVGAIIPDFYFRALQFFEQFDEPLLEVPARTTRELYIDPYGRDELWLGPHEEMPDLTYREFYARYQPEMIEFFEEDWGADVALDDLMDPEWYWDYWWTIDSPAARAFHYLQTLDLGPELAGPSAVGGLEFYEDANFVSQWCGVRYEDDVTLSLLQKRLNDLGTGIRVIPDPYYAV
jgi:hypothetical protein